MYFSSILLYHAGDFTVKADHQLGPRRILDYEIVYFPLGNKTVYECNGTPYLLDSPSVVVTRPGEPHAYHFDSEKPCRHLFIHFDLGPDMPQDGYRILQDAASGVIKLHDRSLIPQLMKQMLYLFHAKPSRWRQQAEPLLLYMLEELESTLETGDAAHQVQGMPTQISTALHYIDAHAREPIEVEQLAHLVGWSHEHFSRMFMQHVGHSPKQWIIKRKIDMAAQLLLQQADSVKMIARSLGFVDEYYFHRLFRRTMGMTASEYRRKYGDNRMRDLAPPDDWGRFYPLNHYFVLDPRAPSE